jgi:hypothetical protein
VTIRGLTVNWCVASHLLATGTPSFTKTDVGSVSAIPCASLISIGQMHGAKLALLVMAGQEEMLDVAMVILSSSMVLHAKRYWVGSRGAAETKL